MNGKADNVIRIPTSLNGRLFRYWFEFLYPFHKLTDREIDVITSFVKHRYELSKVIKDNDILDKVTMSDDIKKKVMQNCNITTPHFQVIILSTAMMVRPERAMTIFWAIMAQIRSMENQGRIHCKVQIIQIICRVVMVAIA